MFVTALAHLLLTHPLSKIPLSEGGPSAETWSKALVTGDIPGLSVAKVEAGLPKWNNAVGRRDALDRSTKAASVDAETVFEAASLGKPIVALAILSLVEDGKLHLDDKSDSIVQLDGLTDKRRSEITLRMLLSHSSGLAFNQPQLESKPGSRFSYSTLGFRYLQQIAEKKLGVSLEDWANRTLFQPLLMKRSSFVYSPRFADNRAKGMNWLLRGQSQMTSASGTGAFDLITTSTDYARLWAAVLGGKVIRESSLRAMFTPQVRITGEFFDPSIPKQSRAELAAGLGILLQRQGSRWVGFQWGDNGGSTGLLLADPAKREALVFLTNAEAGLHSAELLVRLGGMRDVGASWVGYEQVSTRPRKAWKQITQALDRDPTEGLEQFRKLTVKDTKTAEKMARNLGYFNLFRGEPLAAEPFFRVASRTASVDGSMLQDWAQCLVVSGKVSEAAVAQARAIKLDPSTAGGPSLTEWVKTAEADLKDEVPLSKTPPVGKYGGYLFELDSGGQLVIVSPTGRRPLALLRSGNFLSRDLAYRVEFKDSKALITLAGQTTETLKRD